MQPKMARMQSTGLKKRYALLWGFTQIVNYITITKNKMLNAVSKKLFVKLTENVKLCYLPVYIY